MPKPTSPTQHTLKIGLLVALLLGPAVATHAQVNVSVGAQLSGVSIGINLPSVPRLVVVPGYPVYYAPSMNSNYFFYDGMYWVLYGNDWYASSWYNGPWSRVAPAVVPLYVLRVPVRYYRRPPPYFRGWITTAPPRWGNHRGPAWEHDHRGWDKWDRHNIPRPAPLPSYQRRYSGKNYPGTDKQQEIRQQHYNYAPKEAVVREQYQRPSPPPPNRGNGPRPGDARPPQPVQAPHERPPAQPPAPRPQQPPQAAPGRPASPPDKRPPAPRPDRPAERPPETRPDNRPSQAPQPALGHNTNVRPDQAPGNGKGPRPDSQGGGGGNNGGGRPDKQGP